MSKVNSGKNFFGVKVRAYTFTLQRRLYGDRKYQLIMRKNV
jgi:hypothetical protein